VSVVWWFAVSGAIYVVGGISGGHINPAATIALAASGRFPWRDVIPYIIFQIIGGYLGALFTYLQFYGEWQLNDPEHKNILYAMILYCFYPHPGFHPEYYPVEFGGTGTMIDKIDQVFPLWQGFLVEFMMTFGLLLTVVATTDPDSPMHSGWFAPFIVGFYVFAEIAVIAPLTMAAINPARDWGPRLFAATIGYPPEICIPGYRWTCLNYIFPQIFGALVGVFVYDYALKPYFKHLKK